MKAIKVHQQSTNVDNIIVNVVDQQQPVAKPGNIVVKVLYAGVNPSDVAGVLGLFPKAIWPRHTGRDFSGIVIDGRPELIGKEIWGTGGDLGIKRDGSHASFIVIPENALSEKPVTMNMQEAAGVGVPFITAYEGLRRAGLPQKNQHILIFGGNGKVGQAAAQLASRAGAKVIIVDRGKDKYMGFSSLPVYVINSSTSIVADEVAKITNGHGADIVYNTVGGPCFSDAMKSLAHGGTQIIIADRAKLDVSFNLFNFYRAQQTLVGIDTQELDVIACARILDELKPGFDNGSLKPFEVKEEFILPLENAAKAYEATFKGIKDKIILKTN